MGMTSVTLHDVTDTLSPEHEMYSDALKVSVDAFLEAEKLFADPDFKSGKGWNRDTENDDGDVVYAKKTPKGKMVSITTTLAMDVHSVMEETWNNADTLPEWNSNIDFAKIIVKLTDHVDVITYGNNDILIVSGRDFVSSRIYRKTSNDSYILASRSVDIADYPERKGKVRAWLHLAAARFRADPSNPERTVVDVVMLADLKGMLPKFLTNQVIGKVMLMDAEQNKKHFEKLRRERDGEVVEQKQVHNRSHVHHVMSMTGEGGS